MKKAPHFISRFCKPFSGGRVVWGKPLKVLMVEDSEDDAALTLRELRRSGYEVLLQRVETQAGMAEALQREKWDVIISDYSLPGFSGRAALSFYKEQKLDIPFIIVSGVIGEDTAVEMMKAGAHDYVLKGKLARLAPAVERELREAEIRREGRQAEEDLRASEDRFRSLVQNSIDVITVHDSQMTIYYESPSAANVLGYEPGYWIGKSPLEAVHPDDVGRAQRVLEDLFRKDHGSDLFMEFRFRHASGRWLFLEVIGKNLTRHPRINGVVLTTRDITARKETEEELRNLNRALQFTTKSLEESNAELALSYDATLKGWADALELREKETAGHSHRVVSITLEIAQRMGFTKEKLVHLHRGALLHDIGKNGHSRQYFVKTGTPFG